MNQCKFVVGLEVDCQADEARGTIVKEGSPAAAAGIKPGDLVTRVGSMEIRSGPHYVLALMDRVTAEPVRFVLQRKGAEVDVTVNPRPRGS